LAQTINVLQAVILTNKEKIILTPTYHVMEMYNVHQNATLLPITVKTNDYIFNDQKLPAVSASASKDKNGSMHISIINIDAEKKQDITINAEGAVFKTITGRILSSPKIQDHNTFDEPEKIKPVSFTGFRYNGSTISLQLPPASVVVLEVK
ncbi:MAG: alpha-L-arabinofuranosidase C-terminal domain-containing protein, partial [Bacteroidota bacterium]